MLLGELRGEQKEHEERNNVRWNRLNEKLYVRLLDVNAKRRKENRIYVFILSFIYFQCALRHTAFFVDLKTLNLCSPLYFFVLVRLRTRKVFNTAKQQVHLMGE